MQAHKPGGSAWNFIKNSCKAEDGSPDLQTVTRSTPLAGEVGSCQFIFLNKDSGEPGTRTPNTLITCYLFSRQAPRPAGRSPNCLPGRSCTCGVSYVAVFKTAVSRCCTTGRYVPIVGLEPTPPKGPLSKSGVSTNSTISGDMCALTRIRTWTVSQQGLSLPCLPIPA